MTNDRMRTSGERITIVETLRGMASLSVLVHHWTSCVPGFISNAAVSWFCDDLNIGVYMFFAISGFVMPYALHRGGYKTRDFGTFIVKRIIRLDPPFVVSIAFCLVTAYLATLHPSYHGVPFHLNPLNLVLHLGYLCPFFGQTWVQGGIYWTLGIEFQFYILLALLFPLIVTDRKWLTFLVVAIFTSLCALDGFRYRFHFMTPYVPFFAMGIVTFLFRAGRLGFRAYLAGLGVLSMLACIKFEPHQMLGGVITSLLIGFYKRKEAPLVSLGTISYSLYLFHFPIALKTVNYLIRFPWAVKYNWLVVLVGCGGCLLVAWIMYLLIERPSRMLAQRIEYKRVSVPTKLCKPGANVAA
jgi:peptidoglycan/LPS O-acetylase OafA/YrhL